MAESSAAPATGRPRTSILVLLAIALVALAAYMLWPAAVQPSGPSNPSKEQRKQASAAKDVGETGSLDVGLGQLKQAPAAPEEKGRNPFRFYVPPPPPPPPPPPRPATAAPPPTPPKVGDKNYVPPPIPLKFIGTVEVRGRKVAIFVNTDGKGMPQYAGEGEIVLGQYRVVKIGVESVTVEYLDGRGRQTIPMRG
jgi:hypothetical protein